MHIIDSILTTNENNMSKIIEAYNIKEHNLAGENPYSSELQFKLLKGDIRDNGIVVPVVFYRGLLVDGRHRVKAALELLTDGDGDGLVPYEDLPHKMQLDEVRKYVASLETRRHQTKTQLHIGHWIKLVDKQSLSNIKASNISGISRNTFSNISKINDHFGKNTILELYKGNVVTISDSMRRISTDSIGKIVKFISTIGEMDTHLAAVKDKYEEKIRLRTVDAEEYLAGQDQYGVEAMRRALVKLGS